jgi:hypothetical protein
MFGIILHLDKYGGALQHTEEVASVINYYGDETRLLEEILALVWFSEFFQTLSQSCPN